MTQANVVQFKGHQFQKTAATWAKTVVENGSSKILADIFQEASLGFMQTLESASLGFNAVLEMVGSDTTLIKFWRGSPGPDGSMDIALMSSLMTYQISLLVGDRKPIVVDNEENDRAFYNTQCDWILENTGTVGGRTDCFSTLAFALCLLNAITSHACEIYIVDDLEDEKFPSRSYHSLAVGADGKTEMISLLIQYNTVMENKKKNQALLEAANG